MCADARPSRLNAGRPWLRRCLPLVLLSLFGACSGESSAPEADRDPEFEVFSFEQDTIDGSLAQIELRVVAVDPEGAAVRLFCSRFFDMNGDRSPVERDTVVLRPAGRDAEYEQACRADDAYGNQTWKTAWLTVPGSQRGPASGFTSVDAGDQHNCAIRTDDEIVCWGRETGGSTAAPAGEFIDVAAGDDFSCGVRTDGTVLCWGNIGYDNTDPVDGVERIAAGAFDACALRTDGAVECWGQRSGGLRHGEFTQVTVGGGYACALRTDEGVECWGGQVPEGLDTSARFTSISAGEHHACGVRIDGSLSCWGSNNEGRAEPPSGSYVDVAAGRTHACAIDAGGKVTCWGGQSAPTDLEVVQISAGADHVCGTTADDRVECWGDNSYGQADSPPTD